jgi:4'-phosphopantetheinyl transferase EntD
MQPGLASMICHPDETDMSGICGAVDLTRLRFVAKEAFFKAYFAAMRGLSRLSRRTGGDRSGK